MTGTANEIKRQAISDELMRIEEATKWSAQGQFEQAKIWRSMNLLLGLPASVTAAIAGAAGLAATTNRLIAGVLALAAAGFGAILTTINATHRMTQATAAGNAYLEIQTASRQARAVDLPDMSVEEARDSLRELTSRRDEVNKTAEPIGRLAYWRTKRNIEKDGGQTYVVDAARANASA